VAATLTTHSCITCVSCCMQSHGCHPKFIKNFHVSLSNIMSTISYVLLVSSTSKTPRSLRFKDHEEKNQTAIRQQDVTGSAGRTEFEHNFYIAALIHITTPALSRPREPASHPFVPPLLAVFDWNLWHLCRLPSCVEHRHVSSVQFDESWNNKQQFYTWHML